jgi:DNA polymerase
MFKGPFTVADYSAIEARVLAWLAGETWALEAFAAGRDIYVENATKMGPQYTRADGKVATLALGYNGGIGSLKVMGATGSDAELEHVVAAWRRANPRIVALWHDMEAAFKYGGEAGRLNVRVDGDSRYVQLPSGRSIGYHGVRVGRRTQFRDPQRGFMVDTYGGRLVENATQAVARDVLGYAAILPLHQRGIPVVGHVHDEVIVEGKVPDLAEMICEPLPWSAGLPLAAEQFYCERYEKR